MTTTTFTVPDISCGHCKGAIEVAVSELDGVDKVEVAIEARTVDVSFGAPADVDAVIAAIESQGYDVASS